MKLTNDVRRAFVRAVMQDVPLPDYVKLKEEAQRALVAAMDKNVRECYKTNPKALISQYITHLSDRTGLTLIVGDVKNYREVVTPFLEPDKSRKELYEKLAHVSQACTTVNRLKAALPELAKYLPSESEPTKNLPAVANVVSDLVKLGWKGGKK